MGHQPDWDTLAELQFLLYNRIAGTLNEALSSIALTDMPEAQNKPPGYWKDRAANKVSNVLNLFTAWSYLIRFKRGESIPEQALRPFHVNSLLYWLGLQLQLNAPPQIPINILLKANQETLQEALLLLYSVAYTQGTGVRVTVDSNDLGAWFRVKFGLTRPIPKTLDALLASFGEHWRAQDSAFELATARDFVRLNGSELKLVTTALQAEFVFFVRVAGVRGSSDEPVEAEPVKGTPSPELLSILSPEMGALLGGPPVPDKPDAAPNSAASTLAPAGPARTTPPPIEPAVRSATPPPTAQRATLSAPDVTPIFRENKVEAKPVPPTLDILRPLPPTLTELERRAALRASEQMRAEAALPKPDVPQREGQEAVTPDAEAAAEEAVIVPLKLPVPLPPQAPTVPPASSSTGAAAKTPSMIDPAKTQADPASAAGESRTPALPESPDQPASTASNAQKGDA